MYEAHRREREYFNGVASFVSAAAAYRANKSMGYIRCPCVDCKNEKEFSNVEAIRAHLLQRGFMPAYNRWTEHGEDWIVQDEADNISTSVQDTFVDTHQDTFVDNHEDDEDNLEQMLHDREVEMTSEREFQKFQHMVEDSTTPLYPSCKEEHKKLNVVLTLLQLKASNGWSDKSFTQLLDYIGDQLLTGNVLSCTTYQAKQVICPLGLEV